MATAKPQHPFRNKVFLLAVRSRLVRELMLRNVPRTEAREQAAELDDDVIEECTHRIASDVPPTLHGKVIDTILGFIASPEFLKLIALLLTLFGVAAPDQVTPA